MFPKKNALEILLNDFTSTSKEIGLPDGQISNVTIILMRDSSSISVISLDR